MKRFKFKLQPLLTYRQYLERVAQQNTARAHLDVKTCENQILELKKTFDQHADKIEDVVAKGVSAIEFKRYHQYLDSVETSMENEKSRKTQLEKILKQKLLELKKKSVAKKTMELYRDRLKVEYTQEFLKIEQKESDEVSSIKTARKVSNETA